MAYTPELTYENSCSLRRIAWAKGKPMTSVINQIIETVAQALDHSEICKFCKDKSKCTNCRFNGQHGRN